MAGCGPMLAGPMAGCGPMLAGPMAGCGPMLAGPMAGCGPMLAGPMAGCGPMLAGPMAGCWSMHMCFSPIPCRPLAISIGEAACGVLILTSFNTGSSLHPVSDWNRVYPWCIWRGEEADQHRNGTHH